MRYLTDPMARYKSKRAQKIDPLSSFEVLGYIAAGTYGRVYKARVKTNEVIPTHRSGTMSSEFYKELNKKAEMHQRSDFTAGSPTLNKSEPPKKVEIVAIKKFKTEKDSEPTHFTGLSQSAYRELSLCRELSHPNVVDLVTTILHDKAIYLVFEYAEHDLLQLIQYHCSPSNGNNRQSGTSGVPSKKLAPSLIKSLIYQVCKGVAYLHSNWILHRDLKPANIMISGQGCVKIGDLGLARIFKDPLQSFYSGDKVVVTVWYRAPELLLGCRHYTPAIDMWAVGCIFAEMMSLRPIFKGEEVAVMANKTVSSFQRDQVDKVTKVLGYPTPQQWPAITATPEFRNLEGMQKYKWRLDEWHQHFDPQNSSSLHLLNRLFDYNPETRISAEEALQDSYFGEQSGVPLYEHNCFLNQPVIYPARRVSTADVDMAAPPPQKRSQPQGSDRKKRRQ